MVDPGWYNAAGDPPGSQRYWDGGQWLGEPVYEVFSDGPAQPGYMPAQAPAPSTFPPSLKVMAIVMSVLKAIPLAIGLLFFAFALLVANEIDDELTDLWSELDDLAGLAAAFILAIVVVGALLIGFQFVGAIKERPVMVLVPAIIMTVLDALWTIGAWDSWNDARRFGFDDSPGGAVFLTCVLGAQLFIAVKAIQAMRAAA